MNSSYFFLVPVDLFGSTGGRELVLRADGLAFPLESFLAAVVVFVLPQMQMPEDYAPEEHDPNVRSKSNGPANHVDYDLINQSMFQQKF